PIKILRAKIVSFGGGPLGSWPRANGAPMSTPIANAAAAARKPVRPLIRAPAAPARECWRCSPPRARARQASSVPAHCARRRSALGVAQRAEQALDLLAGLDGVAPPAAGAHEIAGARHLHHPDRWAVLGALLDDAVDREADVRIDPAQLHDLAVDRHGDGMIEHGGGMMRRYRCDTDRNRAGNGEHADGLEMIRHGIDPVAGLFRRHEIAPLSLLDRNEDVMAVLILRFPVVAHLAYALDDVELARALAEEDAGGLPGLGKDVRRGNLELHVQDVLLGKVDAFGDVHVAVVRHAD